MSAFAKLVAWCGAMLICVLTLPGNSGMQIVGGSVLFLAICKFWED